MQDKEDNVYGLTDDLEKVKATRQLTQEDARNRFMSKNDLKDYLRGAAKEQKAKLVAQKFVNNEFGRLQDFIIKEFPDELTGKGHESAVDVAIKLLIDYKTKKDYDKQSAEKFLEMLNEPTSPEAIEFLEKAKQIYKENPF